MDMDAEDFCLVIIVVVIGIALIAGVISCFTDLDALEKCRKKYDVYECVMVAVPVERRKEDE